MIEKITAVCGCLILNKRVLLEWRGDNYGYTKVTNTYVLPGGRVETYDRTMEDALIREWKEETNINIFVRYVISKRFNKVIRYPDNKFYEIELYCYRIGTFPNMFEENLPDNFHWVELDRLDHMESSNDINGDSYAFIQECLHYA